MAQTQYEAWHRDLEELLGLPIPPIGIGFTSAVSTEISRVGRALPPPTADGHTGTAPTGCVFWIEAAERVLRPPRRTTAIAASAA